MKMRLSCQFLVSRQNEHLALAFIARHLEAFCRLCFFWHHDHALMAEEGQNPHDKTDGPDRPPVKKCAVADHDDLSFERRLLRRRGPDRSWRGGLRIARSGCWRG